MNQPGSHQDGGQQRAEPSANLPATGANPPGEVPNSAEPAQNTSAASSRPPKRPFRIPTEPRRVRGGLRITSESESAIVEHAGPWRPIVESWLVQMHASFETEALAEGWQQATQGQIISCAERPGVIDATVPSEHAEPRRLLLHVPMLSDAHWDRLIDAMAGEAIFAASLLAGEWPESLLDAAARQGVELGFSPEHVLQVVQRSGGRENRSRLALNARIQATNAGRADQSSSAAPEDASIAQTQAAAVAFLIAERLARHPLLLMTLRGMSIEQLLQRLRTRREHHTPSETAVHGEPYIPAAADPVLPLEDTIESFWGHDEDLDAIRHRPAVEHAPHALLRRLGPSPLGGRFPLVGLLASIYDHVGEWAVQLRDRTEQLNDDADSDDDRSADDVDA